MPTTEDAVNCVVSLGEPVTLADSVTEEVSLSNRSAVSVAATGLVAYRIRDLWPLDGARTSRFAFDAAVGRPERRSSRALPWLVVTFAVALPLDC